jgi:hypothetical protein
MGNDEGGGTVSCPDLCAWLELAGGRKGQDVRDGLLQHAAECRECAAALGNALSVMAAGSDPQEDALLRMLRSSNSDWRKSTAEVLGQRVRDGSGGSRVRALQPKRGWIQPLLAAAAMILVSIGVTYWIWRERRPPTALLARAYAQHRTIELRLPGAEYGPMGSERGKSQDWSPDLSEGDAAIRLRLGSDPNNVEWLRARGRAELLEWRYEEAIKDLRRALDLGPDASARSQAETLTDLATGYFERAERGDRTDDYARAADLLSQAIRTDGSFALAFFNRAIVYERMLQYPSAIEDWKRYLKFDPHGLWSDEAARRLKSLQ